MQAWDLGGAVHKLTGISPIFYSYHQMITLKNQQCKFHLITYYKYLNGLRIRFSNGLFPNFKKELVRKKVGYFPFKKLIFNN